MIRSSWLNDNEHGNSRTPYFGADVPAVEAALERRTPHRAGLMLEVRGELEAEVAAVLLESVFWVFGAAGVEVFFVEEVVDAGGDVEVFLEGVAEQRGVEDAEAANRVAGKSLDGTGVLCVEAGEEALTDHGDGDIQFAKMARGIGEG